MNQLRHFIKSDNYSSNKKWETNECPNCSAKLQYNKLEDKMYCTKGCGSMNREELRELHKHYR